MTLVAIVADSHFDEHGRFDECVRLHEWMARDAHDRGVTLALHSGDLYERKSTPKERNAAALWVREIASFAPMIIVRGNHDALGDLRILGALDTLFPVDVEEGASVREVLDAAGDLVTVACLAWPQKAAILARAGCAEGASQDAAQALRNVLLGLGAEMDKAERHAPRILLAHAMVRGSVTSTGQPLVGCDLEVGIEDLALARAQLYALGHIHKGQSWDVGGAPAIYPGSPRRTAFGEIEAKGYTIARFTDGQLVGHTFVEAPATPMVHVEATWTGTGWRFAQPIGEEQDAFRGAETRFRYAVPADQRDAARAAAEETRTNFIEDGGAVSVKLEEVVLAETRARAPEIAAATTTADKLSALWASKGVLLSTERRTSVLAKLTTLEAA